MELFRALIPSLGAIVLFVSILIDAVLAIGVYRSNPKSATNRIYFVLGIFIILWLSTYSAYFPAFSQYTLLLVRLGVFFAAAMSTLFFLLAHTIPHAELQLNKKVLWALVGVTVGMMLLNISPYAFSSASISGGQLVAQAGVGLIAFSIISTLLSVLAVAALIKKFIQFQGEEKRQIKLVLIGILLMLLLVIATVLVPLILSSSGLFVAFLPIYTLIFLGLTAYAITKYHLFNFKVIATESLTAVLWIMLLAEIFFSQTFSQTVIALTVFLGTIVFGISLIKSVRREVEQREELETLNAKLDAANQQLEELSHFKSQLLSLASHQIRSPLAAIRGFVSLILDGSYGPVDDKAKQAIQKIGGSADGLINLINTLLDVRKVEEGKMEYQFAKTDLTKIVAEVTSLLEPLAQAKGLEFSFASPGREIFVNADGEKFKQVIQNLVDNAIKYTPSGFVKVELKEDAPPVPPGASGGAKQWRAATVTVSDSGLGVSAALLPHLFEEFIRDERVKKDIRGTGLGLFIARKIAEAHGGKMSATSGGEGKGSVFSVTVPEIAA